MPSDPILEALYKSKLQNSAQLRTVMALHDQEVVRNFGTPNYQRLKTAVKLHIDQMMRNQKFKAGNDVVERGSVTKSQKGNKASVERKVEECFHWKVQGHCSKGDSCSFSHDLSPASGNRSTSSNQIRKGRSSSLASTSKAKRLTKTKRQRKILTREVKFYVGTKIVIIRNVSCWHLPVCPNYKSEKGFLWR